MPRVDNSSVIQLILDDLAVMGIDLEFVLFAVCFHPLTFPMPIIGLDLGDLRVAGTFEGGFG